MTSKIIKELSLSRLEGLNDRKDRLMGNTQIDWLAAPETLISWYTCPLRDHLLVITFSLEFDFNKEPFNRSVQKDSRGSTRKCWWRSQIHHKDKWPRFKNSTQESSKHLCKTSVYTFKKMPTFEHLWSRVATVQQGCEEPAVWQFQLDAKKRTDNRWAKWKNVLRTIDSPTEIVGIGLYWPLSEFSSVSQVKTMFKLKHHACGVTAKRVV